MHSVRILIPSFFLVLTSCGQDITVTQSSMCDGVQQRDEAYVDAPFDRDGDGFFDENNPECSSTYAPEDLDCNDSEETINPNAVETTCDGMNNDCDSTTPDFEDKDGDGYSNCEDCDDNNGSRSPGLTELECNDIDDDCNSDTPDSEDIDGDGSSSCDDCNDLEGRSTPGKPEVCDDNIDNNCNGEVDEDCEASTWDGTWELDTAVTYKCAWGNVTLNFNTLLIQDANPSIQFTSIGGIQPSTMSGTVTSSNDFSVSNVLAGTCTETYIMEGSFTSADTFTATFTAEFDDAGTGLCFDCLMGAPSTTGLSWTFNGTRN